MCPTVTQLRRGIRKKKIRRSRVGAFERAPLRKGVVYKIAVMSPRKPNSARRTYAKVRLSYNGKRLFAKIPGIGDHFLQAHSIVLVRGHGPKDSPGINIIWLGVCMILIRWKLLVGGNVVRNSVLRSTFNL